MITVDREKARAYINEILDDCDPPWSSHVTEKELDTFIYMITDGAMEYGTDNFFYWLDDERGS